MSNRASQIQKFCKIEPGTRGYCRQEIVDAATSHETIDSFVLPHDTIDTSMFEEKKSENPAMRILEFRRQQEEENKKLRALMEENKKASAENRPILHDDKQMKLFE